MGAVLGWWARLVDVRPGERRRVVAMFTLLGLIIATSYILNPVRSSLFLSQFGSERLPYVYILVALVLAIVAFAFARWSRRANLPRLFIGAAYFFAANLVFFWLATNSGWSWTGFVFYVWVSIFTALMPSLFWLLANYVFYANEGRRLFPVVMAGGLFGSIVVGATTSVLVGFIGTPALLLTAAGLLVGIAALIRSNVAHERERMSERRSEIARQEKSRVIRSDENPWTLIARSRYLSMLAILIVLTTTTSTLVDYQFNTVVDQSFDSMDALTGVFELSSPPSTSWRSCFSSCSWGDSWADSASPRASSCFPSLFWDRRSLSFCSLSYSRQLSSNRPTKASATPSTKPVSKSSIYRSRSR